MNSSATNFYKQKAEKYSIDLNSVSQKLKWFAWYRFASFVFIFIPFFAFGFSSILIAVLSFSALLLFFFLVKRNIQLENRKRKLTALKKLAEDELLALSHSFSHFKNGVEFLDTNHFFSYDLDLFGEGSVYQFINRTATKTGGRALAGRMKNPTVYKTEIEQVQQSVQELAQIPNWRIHFRADGLLFEETDEMIDEIRKWSDLDMKLKRSSGIKWLIRLVPLFTVFSAIPALMGISNLFLILSVFIQWGLIYSFWKKITEYFQFFGQKSGLLAKYMQLLKNIEEREFQSEFLLELQKKVISPEPASKIFKQLKSLVKEFEYRQNLLVGLFLNSFFLWDIRCVYKLWGWHQKNHRKLSDWLHVISEMDVLVSLANYSYNYPQFTFPEIHEGGFIFKAENLGHPLLNPQKRVDNNIEITGWSKVMIVTGANMAGKSTFLRTVGVNLILGRMGAPVCAAKMVFTPVEIYTNMRTTDSLLKDESYFFAELKRIKGVLERLQSGERIFVILDEMLKGTNSVDKLNGSLKLIRKLIQYKSVSLIATHDLKLSELENEFPQQVFNNCFEIRIENDELVFDYLLSEGVTKTMNATFLMKKMGII